MLRDRSDVIDALQFIYLINEIREWHIPTFFQQIRVGPQSMLGDKNRVANALQFIF